MDISIWDSRKGENYSLDNYVTQSPFDSLDTNLSVVEINDLTNDMLGHLLRDFSKTTTELSVIVTPWLKKKEFEGVFPVNLNVDYSNKNYLIRGDDLLSHLDSVVYSRTELGGGDSGEWLFIGSQEKVEFSKEEINESFNVLLDRAQCFDFLFFLAEMKQLFIVFKPTVVSDEILKKLQKKEDVTLDSHTHLISNSPTGS